MKRINKVIIFALMLLVSVSAVFADDNVTSATTTIGLDLSDLGYFRIWFSDANGNSHPGSLELNSEKTYSDTFFLNYELISPKEITINLSASGALESTTSDASVDYFVYSMLPDHSASYSLGENKTSIVNKKYSYTEGFNVFSGNMAADAVAVPCTLQLTDGKVDGKPYELYTATLTAKITVK